MIRHRNRATSGEPDGMPRNKSSYLEDELVLTYNRDLGYCPPKFTQKGRFLG